MSRLLLACSLLFSFLLNTNSEAQQPKLRLKQGDHIAYIGNTLADRMQHHAWLETYIHARFPGLNLTFRNLGFPGDELKLRQRSNNFGSPDEWLKKVEADTVFCFFGYNEAFRGKEGLEQFEDEVAETIDAMRAQKYNDESPPQLVVFSPLAHENLNSPHLPDGYAHNDMLKLYTDSMRNVCRNKNVVFVDLFQPSLDLYQSSNEPLTLNGVHLVEYGNKAIANVIFERLFGGISQLQRDTARLSKVREAVLDKNYHWFSRYRVVDGYNVYGGRSKLNWFGQSNADVMMREMEIFDVKTVNRDKHIWAVAKGQPHTIKDDNLPDELTVRTNKPGELEGERHPYLSGQDAISKMTLAEGLEVNLFADEAMFPELVNPVQMAVDTDSRLFVSVWPSYPHWNPTEPRRDRILCFPDENGDGVADECKIFADELNSITGFEFWGGGMLVAAPPEIWFLKDTDGDDIADVRLRMLQGVSSADTHHSANAVVIGPDGGMYWSRGIFNVASMETPTQTYRSGKSGVHRFDPRTFEMSFVYPIGPNPHGDVFDQWGFQFANDGTSGTGSYVNVGKGVKNKQWFKKRVRPVAATGILSSSQFPEANQGNFLICNTIGFLGVLQHEVKYNGADITAEEIEPVLVSTDPNFRPTDVEVGGDGALYVSDWSNILIGHMQHNMRDPNRDHAHGRIYRVTAKNRPLVKPLKLKGKPIAEVCKAFFAKENSARYRARLELSSRDTGDIEQQVSAFTRTLDATNPDDAQVLLECLWVFEEHRVPNRPLLKRVFSAAEPRVRSAAIRTLGHWGAKVEDWQSLLLAAARDESALVRAEAVKAAVEFEGPVTAEVFFEVSDRPTDPEIDFVLNYANGELDINALAKAAIDSRSPLSPAGRKWVLANASVNDLMTLGGTADVYRAILSRPKAPRNPLKTALMGLAELEHQSPVTLIASLLGERDKVEDADLTGLRDLLLSMPANLIGEERDAFLSLATDASSAEARQIGYAALMTADNSGDDAMLLASQDENRLRDFLEAVPQLKSNSLRDTLYDKVRPLMFELPGGIASQVAESGVQQNGIRVDFFYPSASNVAAETLAKMTPTASGIVPIIEMNVPQKTKNDQFALRFTGELQTPKSGRYQFRLSSDDGSRLYIDGKEVINNDGKHGMQEKRANVELQAGSHAIMLTYFDNGGGDGLKLLWSGPGILRQPIPADRLMIGGGETIHDLAIDVLASLPGHDAEKVADLTSLIKSGRSRSAAIRALRRVPVAAWPADKVRPVVDNLVAYVSDVPAAFRNGGPAVDAVKLAKSLSTRLTQEQAKSLNERLQNLDVRVIAIGTVPARMIYDKELIAVQAGKPVEFRFSNSDHMPHNFAIVQPGALQEVGELAEATARDADAATRQYIPKSDKILLASRLIQSGEDQALTFDAPNSPGVYPYVCTYPGHWRRMYGALYVVEDLDAYNSDPAKYLAAHPLPIEDELLTRNTRRQEWKLADLIADAKPLAHGRSFEVGQQAFRVANCVGCHKINNEGRVFGPDLTQLDAKKQTAEYLLTSMLEPSKNIEQKFRSWTFVLTSGKVITGMIVEETADAVHVVIDPLAKGKATSINKDDIDDRVESKLSLMPTGLLNKLSREEILDLVGFVLAKGKKDHTLFKEHAHH